MNQWGIFIIVSLNIYIPAIFITFLVAKLLYNYKCPSVCQLYLCGRGNFKWFQFLAELLWMLSSLLFKIINFFIFRLSSDDESENDEVYDVKKAHERLTCLSESSDDQLQRRFAAIMITTIKVSFAIPSIRNSRFCTSYLIDKPFWVLKKSIQKLLNIIILLFKIFLHFSFEIFLSIIISKIQEIASLSRIVKIIIY